METEAKNKQELNAANAEEKFQTEVQEENVAAENAVVPPKKKSLFKRILIFCIVVAVVGGVIMLITSAFQDEDEYYSEYGDEPSDYPVSHNNGKSNIINQSCATKCKSKHHWTCKRPSDNQISCFCFHIFPS